MNGYSREPELAAKTGSELPALRQRLLYLINTERVRARVPPLTLGVNPAAQLHAENMLAHDYRSHWDINGLTPQMRYTLAGGAGRVLLNLAGPVAISASGDDDPEALRQAISGVHRSFMSQPEDAANLLDPWHQSVSLGVACNVSRCWVVQQFESSHVSFDELPAITGSSLSLAGRFPPGLELDSVAIWHHSYPRPLTLGQLDATYIYGYGQKPATFLRPPPPAGRYYPDALVGYEWKGGIDPYTLEPSLSRSVAPHLPVEISPIRRRPLDHGNPMGSRRPSLLHSSGLVASPGKIRPRRVHRPNLGQAGQGTGAPNQLHDFCGVKRIRFPSEYVIALEIT